MSELRVTVTDDATGAVLFMGRPANEDEYVKIVRTMDGTAFLSARVSDLSASLRTVRVEEKT
jgi:hypothetical protein